MKKLTDSQKGFFEAIKTPLARFTALARLEGLSYDKSYRKGCKKAKKKLSKNPHRSGEAIVKNCVVAEFIRSVEEPEQSQSIDAAIATREEKRAALWRIANLRMKCADKIVTESEGALAPPSMSDAISALAELNKMDGDNAPDKILHGEYEPANIADFYGEA